MSPEALYIARCAAIYEANPQLALRGVLFFSFIADPDAIMRAILFSDAMPSRDVYPLLPAQQRVAERLAAAGRDAR